MVTTQTAPATSGIAQSFIGVLAICLLIPSVSASHNSYNVTQFAVTGLKCGQEPFICIPSTDDGTPGHQPSGSLSPINDAEESQATATRAGL